MKTYRLISLLLVILSCSLAITAQKQYNLKAPGGKLEMNIFVGKSDITYSISHEGELMIDKSPISMTLTDGTGFGIDPKVSKIAERHIDETINSPVYKKAVIKNQFNELTIYFKGNYQILFRAYDDGIAYRFVSDRKEPFIVRNEQSTFNFPTDTKAYIPYARGRKNEKFEDQFFGNFQNTYDYIKLSEWDKEKIAFLPIVTEGVNGKRICITESDLLNYPGMFLHNADKSTTLKGIYAPYPKDVVQGGHNKLQGIVNSREEYIAKAEGKTDFPWRIIIVAENDTELLNNDMVYKLAKPAQFTDVSWIKPGKVAWDWWNAWGLYNVDFRAGINNSTYKYYIDFASEHGIEYVILDEGWSVNGEADLYQIVPEINLKELISYATERNVGIILWAGYYAFDKDIEGLCRHYAAMGVKGFKVDFMDRDDQPMVDFYHRAARIGAEYKLLMDFHGSYKPTGLQRTYPNVINFEGVFGLEEMKWSDTSVDQVVYDVTAPFIRMIAGPMDYTQGAMRNGIKKNYYPIYSEPISQGTRCRQLAEYVIFESPLNMMCDSPSNYMKEEECTRFIASIPTVWDETKAINGEIGKYVAIARRKGDVWYLGALTDWNIREMNVDLSSLLDKGEYEAEIFRDGLNADRIACDYKKEIIRISSDNTLKFNMAPGGGYIARITKIK